ncbi:MAG: peptidase S41, partial [Proteobacteria bacterium]|nr:peptidase S41 [Pseudomonadota bacterium]
MPLIHSFQRPLILLLAVGLIATWTGPAPAATQEDAYAKIKVFSLVLSEIQRKYVEDKASQDLIYGAIRGMVKTLDPHSSFLTPEELKEFQIETQGSFTGVGIEITLKDGVLTVVSPIENTPAFR